MRKFINETRSFFRELGVPDYLIDKFIKSCSYDYVNFLENEVGAKKVYYCQSLRAIEEVGHRGLILPGGNVVVLSQIDGKPAILVQLRENGEIGFAGGAVEEWDYNGKSAIEPPILCAYREFFEEVGIGLDAELTDYATHTSTIVCPNGDIAYGMSLFYKVEVPEKTILRFAEGGSYEGKMSMIKVKDIVKYPLFPNHEPVFRKIQEEYKSRYR